MQAVVQYQSGGTWYTLGGGTLNYLHGGTQTTGVTSQMQALGTSIEATMLKPSSGCWNPTHLHEAADLDGGYFIKNRNVSGETCWILTDGWQCPDTYEKDKASAACPPGAIDSVTGVVSGDITRYVCQGWSKEYRSLTGISFFGWW